MTDLNTALSEAGESEGLLPGRADLLCDWPGERGSHGAEDAGNEAGDNCPLLKMIRDQAQFTQLTSHETSEHRNGNSNNGAGSTGAVGAGSLYRSTGTGLTRAVAWYSPGGDKDVKVEDGDRSEKMQRQAS